MKTDSPIVVGGGGGSGTRVVAEILKGLGVDTGFDLNGAHDDLTWTLLFKRRWWKAKASPADIDAVMSVYDRFRAVDQSRRPGDLRLARRAAVQRVFGGMAKTHLARAKWGARRYLAAADRTRTPAAALWGWKEPNTHVYLPELVAHYSGLRYIHMMRHGLDMALSTNQSQVHHWCSEFGLPPLTKTPTPQESLAYWVRSNQRAVTIGKDQLGDRFLCIKFEDLCDHPKEQITRLATFIGVDVDTARLDALSALPRTPASRGRFVGTDLAVFEPADIDALQALGYSAESADTAPGREAVGA